MRSVVRLLNLQHEFGEGLRRLFIARPIQGHLRHDAQAGAGTQAVNDRNVTESARPATVLSAGHPNRVHKAPSLVA